MNSYLRKTFLWYDPLPTKEFVATTTTTTTTGRNSKERHTVPAATITDGILPKSPEEVEALVQPIQNTFPKTFLWGTATAAYQVEGNLHHCNWSKWEQRRFRLDGHPTVEHHECAGKACDSWNLFDTDLQHLKLLGVKMYRFSVEWSRVEPTQGTFDQSAIERYQSWCQKLLQAGIEPMITLHHFTEPAWFGGWEDRDNLQFFERFVQTVCQALAPYCRYWTTINELNGYAICGWLAGVHPPGKVNDIFGLLRVVRHLLVAHTLASRAIRSASAVVQKDDPVICMALNHVYFLPLESSNVNNVPGNLPNQQLLRTIWYWMLNWINRFLSNAVSLFLNYAYNFVILDALFAPRHAGRFPLLPFPFHLAAFLGGWSEDIRNLKASADWIGVNHYYRSYVTFGRQPNTTTNTNDNNNNINNNAAGPQAQQRQASPTDMFIALPLGMEIRATAIPNFEKNEMGWDLTPSSMDRLLEILWDRYQPIPIIITESGTADRTDQKRVRYIAAILTVLNKFLNKGMDLKGYLIWTLLDNFEWAEGYRPKFGLLETNFESMERKERLLTCNLLRHVFPKE